MGTKKFKCKDEVIYRIKLNEDSLWTYGIFSHYQVEGRIYSQFVNFPDDPEFAVIDGHEISLLACDIVPYKGNEGLVGTNFVLPGNDEILIYRQDYEVIGKAKIENGIDLRNRDIVIVFYDIEELDINNPYLHKYPLEGVFLYECRYKMSEISVGSAKYFIRFSDFNPNDMEATKDKILCVRNGKIIRYKG